ncbi:MAG: FAD-binding oxidoreductase [Acidimicrobiia bacterium]
MNHRGANADDALLAALQRSIGHRNARAEALELALYGRDASTITDGRAAIVCFPSSLDDVVACVRLAREHDRPFVVRGSGTGLAGGAVPLDGAVVIVTTKMDRLLSVDAINRIAWVEPGLLNLDLSKQVARHGLHFAPDPSSQQSCSLGGNVANNSGGPHCLAYGVTSSHVLALEVVLPDATVVTLGGIDPEPDGLDLRGAFIGSEGTMGVVTKIAVRLTQNPPALRTMLLDFANLDDGAATVSAIIASGLVPAAIEMMDARATAAVEAFVHAGFPLDAAAVLIVEVDGLPAAVDDAVERVQAIGAANGARSVRVAASETERALWWKGRKSAFGAIANIKPDYYLHDTVVPRSKLVEVLRQVNEICDRHGVLVMNVFHAGDGNLHPLLIFDAREPGAMERVHEAGAEIVKASVAAGGVLSGEHGIGLEKRDFMALMFSDEDIDAQKRLRCAFDPDGVANPGKVLPRPASCGDVMALGKLPDGAWV